MKTKTTAMKMAINKAEIKSLVFSTSLLIGIVCALLITKFLYGYFAFLEIYAGLGISIFNACVAEKISDISLKENNNQNIIWSIGVNSLRSGFFLLVVIAIFLMNIFDFNIFFIATMITFTSFKFGHIFNLHYNQFSGNISQ